MRRRRANFRCSRIVSATLAAVALAACGRPAPDPEPTKPPASPTLRAPDGASSGGGFDAAAVAAGPQRGDAAGAQAIAQSYYARLEAGDYAGALALWRPGGDGRPTDAAALARRTAGYVRYHAVVGSPGDVEGAAGSLYVTIPVEIEAQRRDGSPARLRRNVVLRRVNDVPGSSAAERAWGIERIELVPAGTG